MGYLGNEAPVDGNISYDDTIGDFRQPEIINLREALQTYAWKRYLKSVHHPSRIVKRKDRHYFKINFDELAFQHSTRMTKVDTDDFVIGSSKQYLDKHGNDNRHSYMNLDISTPQVINTADFQGIGDEDERCDFKTNTNTKAKFTVMFSESYSLGNSTNIELTVPGDLVAPTSYVDYKLFATKSNSQRFRKVVNWTVAAEINVKAGHRTRAILCAEEQQTFCDFEVLTNVSLKGAWLPVNVYRKTDNVLVYSCLVTDLHRVFRRHQGPNVCLKETSDEQGRVSRDVTVISKGVCKILGWANLLVFLTPRDIRLDTCYDRDVEL